MKTVTPHRLTTCDVRAARVPEDSEAIVTICNSYDSEPLSVSEFERLYESWDPRDPRARLVATDSSGKIVGTVHSRRRASTLPGLFLLNLCVRHGHTGHGVGGLLLEQAETFALANGGDRIIAFVPEGKGSGQEFAVRHGYAHTRTLFESTLDVTAVDDDFIDEAVGRCVKRLGARFESLSTLGHTGENLRRFYEVSHECDKDEPSTSAIGEVSWEDFQRQVANADWFRPEGILVALVNGKWAGVHSLGPLNGSHVADMTTDFTGVLRPYRGQGLAIALKCLGVRYARSLGRHRIVTHNDSTNEAMLGINRKLGFVGRPGWLLMTKALRRPLDA